MSKYDKNKVASQCRFDCTGPMPVMALQLVFMMQVLVFWSLKVRTLPKLRLVFSSCHAVLHISSLFSAPVGAVHTQPDHRVVHPGRVCGAEHTGMVLCADLLDLLCETVLAKIKQYKPSGPSAFKLQYVNFAPSRAFRGNPVKQQLSKSSKYGH